MRALEKSELLTVALLLFNSRPINRPRVMVLRLSGLIFRTTTQFMVNSKFNYDHTRRYIESLIRNRLLCAGLCAGKQILLAISLKLNNWRTTRDNILR